MHGTARWGNVRRQLGGVVMTVTLAAGLVACGDDGDDTAAGTTTTTGSATTAGGEGGDFCADALAIGAPEEPDIDFETATDEEIRAAEVTFVEEQFQPHVDAIATSGPEAVQDDARRLSEIIAEVVSDPESDIGGAIFTGEGGTVRGNIVAAAAGECGWGSVGVSAVEYAFEGVPDTAQAGTVAFELTNNGRELHEMVVFRKNDGVEQTFEELLEMPEEEAQGLVTFVTAAVADQGTTTWTVGELEPGEYAMVCFVSVGTTEQTEQEEQSEEESGPPHFTQGMIQTFSVE